MKTENLSTLKIHKLTQEQYDRELAAGNLDETALYLTPDEPVDLSGYATLEQLNDKADISLVPTSLSQLAADATHRLVTDEEKTKLANIADGAEVNVQSSWNQNDSQADDYIQDRTHWVEYSDLWASIDENGNRLHELPCSADELIGKIILAKNDSYRLKKELVRPELDVSFTRIAVWKDSDLTYDFMEYSTAGGAVNKLCFIMFYSFLPDNIKARFSPAFIDTFSDYTHLVYVYETTSDVLGMGLTLDRGWYVVNVNTFAYERYDIDKYPVFFPNDHVVDDEYARCVWVQHDYFYDVVINDEYYEFMCQPYNLVNVDDDTTLLLAGACGSADLDALDISMPYFVEAIDSQNNACSYVGDWKIRDVIVHQLDELFIPDSIARTADVNDAITSAIADKADKAHDHNGLYYTEAEVNNLLKNKADASVIPTKLSDLAEDTSHRTVTKAEKDKLATIAKGAEVNVQSDWLTNDGTSDGYIKNRTHWQEMGTTKLVDNFTFQCKDGEYLSPLPMFNLQYNAEYTVVWDGVLYEHLVSFGFGRGAGIGSEDDAYSTYPFRIITECGYVGIFTRDTGNSSHTISIVGQGTIMHHLDPKYIKDMYSDTRIELNGTVSNIVWNQTDGSTASSISFDISDELNAYFNSMDSESYKRFIAADLTINNTTQHFASPDFTLDQESFVDEDEEGTYPTKTLSVWGIFDIGCYGAENEFSIDLYNLEPFGLNEDNIEGATEISFKFYGGELKKLDEKFIPDTIARKAEFDAMELISVSDIDAICGANIKSSSEVEF